MAEFAVFDSFGNLCKTGFCTDPAQIADQATDGQSIVLLNDEQPTRQTHYLKNGELTVYTEEEQQRRANCPHPLARWDNDLMAWIDSRPFECLIADKWSKIKAVRDIQEFSTFTSNGNTFDGDSESQRRIQGAVQLAVIAQTLGQPFSIDWTLADNSVVTLDAAEMIGVGQALAIKVGNAYATARALREQIEAATTAEELEAIQWPA